MLYSVVHNNLVAAHKQPPSQKTRSLLACASMIACSTLCVSAMTALQAVAADRLYLMNAQDFNKQDFIKHVADEEVISDGTQQTLNLNFMKTKFIVALGVVSLIACTKKESITESTAPAEKKLFLDVHDLGPGNVTFDAVADAHKKDLATQGEFGVSFIKYWVDEKAGKVYCLAESSSEADLFKTHKKAHGLVPDDIMLVSGGKEAALNGKQLFLDIHHLEPGSVTAKDVAGAHEKDLAVQGKYDVNFINYWVDERMGTVVCLSEAPDSLAVIKTHTEAHGLVPAKVERVKQGM